MARPASAHTSADAQNSNFDYMEARRKHPRRRVEIEQDFGTSRWGGSCFEPISVGRRCERGLYVAFWHQASKLMA